MKKVGEMWVVLVRQPDCEQYTQIVADRDSAWTWIAEDMDLTVENCCDDDEIVKYMRLQTISERSNHVADMFDRVYEIELKYVMARDSTTLDEIKEAINDRDVVPKGS